MRRGVPDHITPTDLGRPSTGDYWDQRRKCYVILIFDGKQFYKVGTYREGEQRGRGDRLWKLACDRVFLRDCIRRRN